VANERSRGRSALSSSATASGTHEAERPELAKLRLGELELIVVTLPAERAATGLTPAEDEVAQLAVGGCSNREIAARRGASVRTVANQLRSIYQKLGVASRYELAVRLGRS
jgi:DNA-binding CsgD family transcriptional regulator